ncbi:MAG: phosphoheptose isomerase, partial [Clostridia bacterium]|nr:phosphoheptose isomerase [Clostridia bacterium]
ANALGLTTVALTGAAGGKLKSICDMTIAVPATETYQVQEYHLPIYHELCAQVEAHFFAE